MYFKELIFLVLLTLSASVFSFEIELDNSKYTKKTCRSQLKKRSSGKTYRVSLKGCCSHHKGIKQCALDKVVTFRSGHLKCVDGWKSTCKLSTPDKS